MLENSDGKLLITKDTLENLVNTIVKSFDGAENAVARIELDNENNLKVFVNISVKENAVIKELSSNIQARIKEAIKTTSDLDVKEVNIKVKDVAPVKKTVVQEKKRSSMDNIKEFISRYFGAIIGVIVAIILLCTHLYKVIIGIILIFVCGYVGNYVQMNKEDVKEKLKNIIDRL